jgi:hypothetical protein
MMIKLLVSIWLVLAISQAAAQETGGASAQEKQQAEEASAAWSTLIAKATYFGTAVGCRVFPQDFPFENLAVASIDKLGNDLSKRYMHRAPENWSNMLRAAFEDGKSEGSGTPNLCEYFQKHPEAVKELRDFVASHE